MWCSSGAPLQVVATQGKNQSKIWMLDVARSFISSRMPLLMVEAHGTPLFQADGIILSGSGILKIEEEHQNIKMVESSVCYNAYTLLRSRNM